VLLVALSNVLDWLQSLPEPAQVQAYGYLRDHDEALVLEGDGSGRRLLVAYRTGNRLSGVLAAGIPPKALRTWRSLIAASTPWAAAVTDPSAA
jgi:hypothetical protein